jgi:hypothetical protein
MSAQKPGVRYVHKDHPQSPCDLSQMHYWMGKDRRCEGMVWAIFDVLTPDQQAAVLAQFGWRQIKENTAAATGQKGE